MEDGDLVVMGGTCQHTHKHAVPPSAKRNGSYWAEYIESYRRKVDSSNSNVFFLTTFFFNPLYMFFPRDMCCTMLHPRADQPHFPVLSEPADRAESESVKTETRPHSLLPLCASRNLYQFIDIPTWTLLHDTLMYDISYFFEPIYNVGRCWFMLIQTADSILIISIIFSKYL